MNLVLIIILLLLLFGGGGGYYYGGPAVGGGIGGLLLIVLIVYLLMGRRAWDWSSWARNKQSRSLRNDDFLQLGTIIFMPRNPQMAYKTEQAVDMETGAIVSMPSLNPHGQPGLTLVFKQLEISPDAMLKG
jgi:hypothetical protein